MSDIVMTDTELYDAKVNWFKEHDYVEVEPLAFYRDLYPIGSFQAKGDYSRKCGNGILLYRNEGKFKHRYIFDDLEEIKNWIGKEDIFVRGGSFIGKRVKNENASMIYALTFDLDGQGLDELHMIMQFMRNGTNVPMATYVVLSGHGLHLYYLLDKPIRATQDTIRQLNKLKEGMTKLIWNRYTSTIEKPQYQYCLQGFRMVGSASKMGANYPVRAYKTGDRMTIEKLVSWIPRLKDWDEYRINLTERSTVPLAKAKEIWPDWYERKIVKQEDNKWHINRALYDWWLNKIKEGATYGHRYFCVMCLAIFAIKCDISEYELRKDAYSLIPILDALSKDNDESSRFTKDDVDAALHGFRDEFKTWGRDKIALISAIPLQANKRNYLNQKDHLEIARGIRDIRTKQKGKSDWREGNGRPKGCKNSDYPKAEIVKQWCLDHPNGKKIDCHRDTGLSRMTINKWWNISTAELKRQQIINKIEFIRNKTIQLNEISEVLYPNTSEEIAEMRKNSDTVLELNRLGISFEQLENQHEIYVEDSVTFQELIEKEFGDDWIDALNLYLDYKRESK
jgi:hypothetical protein